MPRRIKRYDNRKLYDTEASEYVSLDDVAELVRSGETVEVVDNATGEDLTAQTLTQIILEEGKDGRQVIPSDLLHQLLRRSGKMFDTGIDQIRSTVDDLMQSSLGASSSWSRVLGPRSSTNCARSCASSRTGCPFCSTTSTTSTRTSARTPRTPRRTRSRRPGRPIPRNALLLASSHESRTNQPTQP
jgi:polyhydroxyalkanoate synthesis repressor PhaR